MNLCIFREGQDMLIYLNERETKTKARLGYTREPKPLMQCPALLFLIFQLVGGAETL